MAQFPTKGDSPVTWNNALARLVLNPAVVALGDYLFAGIHFAAPSQWIATGVVLAVISLALDTIFLDNLGMWWSALIIAILFAGIIYLSPSLMAQVAVTRPGAIGMGLLLGLVEVIMYWSLNGTAKVGRA